MKMSSRSFNKVRLLVITILTLFFVIVTFVSKSFASNSEITNLLKSNSTNNSYIVEKLRPSKENR